MCGGCYVLCIRPNLLRKYEGGMMTLGVTCPFRKCLDPQEYSTMVTRRMRREILSRQAFGTYDQLLEAGWISRKMLLVTLLSHIMGLSRENVLDFIVGSNNKWVQHVANVQEHQTITQLISKQMYWKWRLRIIINPYGTSSEMHCIILHLLEEAWTIGWSSKRKSMFLLVPFQSPTTDHPELKEMSNMKNGQLRRFTFIG